MRLKILHNPRCSKSRQTLAILKDNSVDVEIIEYLKEIPTRKIIEEIIQLLNINPRDLLRKGEAVYKEKNLSRDDLSDDEIISLMLENPILIERPIVFGDNLAIIGRPPENVMKFLKWVIL